jgi:hypothetical protein
MSGLVAIVPQEFLDILLISQNPQLADWGF